jgi:DNA-binding transcriptional LysR family regulator
VAFGASPAGSIAVLHARLLTYLDEVARAGSIRRAAERLGIAASSINRQIIALEADLGVQLFERMPRRLRLTVAGELLITHVRHTLREHDRLRERLADLAGHRRGLVTLATMAGLASSLLPDIVAWLGANHPYLKLVVRIQTRQEITAAVTSGDADLGLGYQMASDPKLRVLARGLLRLGAVVAPGHPLANEPGVSLGDCVGYRMIIPDRRLTLGELLVAALERVSVSIDTLVETNSIELLKRAAEQELAVTFLNELDIAPERRAGRLVFLPLPISQVARQELRLVCRARGSLDTAQSLVAERLRETIQAFDAEHGAPA